MDNWYELQSLFALFCSFVSSIKSKSPMFFCENSDCLIFIHIQVVNDKVEPKN